MVQTLNINQREKERRKYYFNINLVLIIPLTLFESKQAWSNFVGCAVITQPVKLTNGIIL